MSYRSEADRLAKSAWRLQGVKRTIDALEEFFEMHERELVDEILNTVILRINVMKDRSR